MEARSPSLSTTLMKAILFTDHHQERSPLEKASGNPRHQKDRDNWSLMPSPPVDHIGPSPTLSVIMFATTVLGLFEKSL